MARGPQIAMLPDGKRLHLQYGPTDLVVEADGDPDEVAAAYRQAITRFRTILPELVGELSRLREPASADMQPGSFRWSTARRMADAVRPHRSVFVTPMAGVAGAVADEVLAALTQGRRLDRAYVNNGGDIAIFLTEGAEFTVGLIGRPDKPEPAGKFTVTHDVPVRGVATSGWRGRSHSLGIADAVTVLARNAAAADVAATLIANKVNINHPGIERRPAQELDPDSDLGMLPVTVSVGALDGDSRRQALDAGLAAAEAMRDARLIFAAALLLDGMAGTVGAAQVQALPAGA